MAKKKKLAPGTICVNKKASFNYSIEETIEAGVVLCGTEVKAIREGKAQINESYAYFKDNELYILNSNIAEFSHGNINNHEPDRSRKLLLHKSEIRKLKQRKERENISIIPLKLYWSKGNVKCQLGIGIGKNTIDKRNTIKEREWKRSQHRILKNG
ncbi:MAG TPA: SsrA-binding protein [Alphaproteobacteria bacterium]|nr:SsrA-binding protein [Alphaproteobacteria bacterium]